MIWGIGSDETIWYNKRNKWHQVDGAATRVSVDSAKNTVWVANREGQIYKRDRPDGQWTSVGGTASDLSVREGYAINLSFQVIGQTNGKAVYLSTKGSNWERVGSLTGISAVTDVDGTPIILTSAGGIYRKNVET